MISYCLNGFPVVFHHTPSKDWYYASKYLVNNCSSDGVWWNTSFQPESQNLILISMQVREAATAVALSCLCLYISK